MSSWSRSFFLRWITADPSPWGNFTPPMTTDIVWRDPGGSWACLWPASGYEWIHPFIGLRDADICMWRLREEYFFSSGESLRTPPLRELHSTDETIVWRDPGGFEPVYDLFTITSKFTLPEAVTDMWGLCAASHMEQFVFPIRNQRGPHPLRELHSTDKTIVWRPRGIWTYLRLNSPCYVTHACGVFVEQATWSSSFFRPWISAGPSP